jgi:hypothetical protein
MQDLATSSYSEVWIGSTLKQRTHYREIWSHPFEIPYAIAVIKWCCVKDSSPEPSLPATRLHRRGKNSGQYLTVLEDALDRIRQQKLECVKRDSNAVQSCVHWNFEA